MKSYLQIVLTTCVVGFGVWFGLLIIIHGLFSAANLRLFETLSIVARLAGVLVAVCWGLRRVLARRVNIPERSMFVFAFLSLSFLFYLVISGEVQDFRAVDPLVAARRVADRHGIHGDSITFLGTTSTGVRVYTVEKDGKSGPVIGVAPRFRLWWKPAFNMEREYYEKHDIGKPLTHNAPDEALQ